MPTDKPAAPPDGKGAYIHQPGSSELRWTGETRTHFLATGRTTDDAFCLIDEIAGQGEVVPLHRHDLDRESFYVLSGELSIFIADQPPVRIPAGGFAHVPGGIVHGFRVESETARYLILTTPHHGEFYRAISRASRPGGLPPESPISDDEIMAACGRYDVEFVGPLPD